MPFYLRKGFNFGPLRLNLSKSGVGASVGVKGFRVGLSPRGSYVHAGRGGLYYRKTFRRRPPATANPGLPAPPRQRPKAPLFPSKRHDSVPSDQLQPDTHGSWLADASACRRRIRPRFAWWLATAALAGLTLFGIFAAEALGAPLTVALVISGAAATGWITRFLYARLALARSTSLLYDLEPEVETAWKDVYDAFIALAQAGPLWRVQRVANPTSSHRPSDTVHPTHCEPVTLLDAAPPWLHTNTSALQLAAGAQTFILLPDALLIEDARGVGAVRWDQMEPIGREARVQGPMPPQTGVSAGTGEVLRYSLLHLRSPNGLDAMFLSSATQQGAQVAKAIRRLGRVVDPR